MTERPHRAETLRALAAARADVAHGDALAEPEGPTRLQRLLDAFAAFAPPPGSTSHEPLPLVAAGGAALLAASGRPLIAPRWLCHLLGLRHRSAHVVLLAPRPSSLVILQLRAAWKDTAPGRLDTTAGGHVGLGREPRVAALDELEEELGLPREALDGALSHLGTLLAVDASSPHVLDVELVDAYLGRLASNGLARVKFRDGEVSRLVLAPPDECWRLLGHGSRRMAAGARSVLPRALEAVERGSI